MHISLCPVYSNIITNLLIVSNRMLLSKNHLLLVIYIRICRTDLLEESPGFEPEDRNYAVGSLAENWFKPLTQLSISLGDASGVRSRVLALKGLCPSPLDDGAI